MNVCKKCETLYHWEKSASSLKMTYCGVLCEIAHLGFHINSFSTSEIVYNKRKELVTG